MVLLQVAILSGSMDVGMQGLGRRGVFRSLACRSTTLHDYHEVSGFLVALLHCKDIVWV